MNHPSEAHHRVLLYAVGTLHQQTGKCDPRQEQKVRRRRRRRRGNGKGKGQARRQGQHLQVEGSRQDRQSQGHHHIPNQEPEDRLRRRRDHTRHDHRAENARARDPGAVYQGRIFLICKRRVPQAEGEEGQDRRKVHDIRRRDEGLLSFSGFHQFQV